MVTPGVYVLAATAITTALTNSAQTAITSLDGMSSANLVAELLGGTAGTTIVGLVQTSFDGTVWLDVARFDFNTADSPPTAGKKYCVLQTNAAKSVTEYAALAVEGMNDGLLGDRLRAVLTSTGTYTDTTLSIRAAVH